MAIRLIPPIRATPEYSKLNSHIQLEPEQYAYYTLHVFQVFTSRHISYLILSFSHTLIS